MIKASLLAHYEVTGKWLSAHTKGVNEKKGSFVLEHGPCAGQISVSALQSALRSGVRGLPGGSSIAQLNEEISKEHGLDYINHMEQDDLDISLIKASLLAHRTAEGNWLSKTKKGLDGKSFVLEHGPYAGQITVSALHTALNRGVRGLDGGSSIAQLNAELSAEYGLDYVKGHHRTAPVPEPAPELGA